MYNENNQLLYYKKWHFDELFTPEKYTGNDGFVIFSPWSGGFNNIRMSLELAVCIAYISNRVLVLPPKYKMYLLKDNVGLEDFFDVTDIGIRVIFLKEFCNIHNIEHTLDAARSVSRVTKVHEDVIYNFSENNPPSNFIKHRKIISIQSIFENSKNVFFDGNLIGNFYMKLHSDVDVELRKLIARHVHYLPPIFEMVKNAVNFLGDKEYYAIHIRRNDFQYKYLFISPEEILKNIENIIPENSKLYIATDHDDKDFFKGFLEKYKVFFYDDIKDHLGIVPHYNYIPIIEQLICTRAIKFVGNDLSTLSSYAYRIRGYMDDIEDKNYYINTKPFTEQDQVNFVDHTPSMGGSWPREYRDGWEF